MQKICKIHGLTDYSEGSNVKCRKCSVIAVTKRRMMLKKMAVDYKGGCCSICGYNKCVAALHFHHVDPSTKSFTISTEGNTRGWKLVKQEADKCILVCANCHAELHS